LLRLAPLVCHGSKARQPTCAPPLTCSSPGDGETSGRRRAAQRAGARNLQAYRARSQRGAANMRNRGRSPRPALLFTVRQGPSGWRDRPRNPDRPSGPC
jgi:hypothetical protein